MASCRCNMHPIFGVPLEDNAPHIFAVNCSVRVPHHWRFPRAFAPRPEPLFLLRFQADASPPADLFRGLSRVLPIIAPANFLPAPISSLHPSCSALAPPPPGPQP